MIIMLTMMSITERTAQMTAHLLNRIATQPDRRDKLNAARSEAIERRDWKAMDETTKRIAKLAAK